MELANSTIRSRADSLRETALQRLEQIHEDKCDALHHQGLERPRPPERVLYPDRTFDERVRVAFELGCPKDEIAERLGIGGCGAVPAVDTYLERTASRAKLIASMLPEPSNSGLTIAQLREWV